MTLLLGLYHRLSLLYLLHCLQPFLSFSFIPFFTSSILPLPPLIPSLSRSFTLTLLFLLFLPFFSNSLCFFSPFSFPHCSSPPLSASPSFLHSHLRLSPSVSHFSVTHAHLSSFSPDSFTFTLHFLPLFFSSLSSPTHPVPLLTLYLSFLSLNLSLPSTLHTFTPFFSFSYSS